MTGQGVERGVANEQAECKAVDVPSAAWVFSDKTLVVFPVAELIVQIASDGEQ